MSHPLARPAIGATAALAATLALTLGTVTQAQAAARWVAAPCATGQFTALETSDDGQAALHGEATACEPAHASAAFTLVVFYPQDYFSQASPDSLLAYQAEGPTPFSGVFRSIPSAREAGVCIMRTVSDRIACVLVTFPQDGPATMEPIPTNDPLVAKPVVFVDWPDDDPTPPPGGFCGTCLDLPVG